MAKYYSGWVCLLFVLVWETTTQRKCDMYYKRSTVNCIVLFWVPDIVLLSIQILTVSSSLIDQSDDLQTDGTLYSQNRSWLYMQSTIWHNTISHYFSVSTKLSRKTLLFHRAEFLISGQALWFLTVGHEASFISIQQPSNTNLLHIYDMSPSMRWSFSSKYLCFFEFYR